MESGLGLGQVTVMTQIVLWLAIALAMLICLAGAWLWAWHRRARALHWGLLHEADSLCLQARAMAAEIARRHIAGEPLDATFFAMWRLSEPRLYPATVNASAYLDHRAIGRLGAFHGLLSDARQRLVEARIVGVFHPSPYRMLACLVHAVNGVEPWLGEQRNPIQPPEEQTGFRTANALVCDLERSGEEPIARAYCWHDCAS